VSESVKCTFGSLSDGTQYYNKDTSLSITTGADW
jgi:hypothetical protein